MSEHKIKDMETKKWRQKNETMKPRPGCLKRWTVSKIPSPYLTREKVSRSQINTMRNGKGSYNRHHRYLEITETFKGNFMPINWIPYKNGINSQKHVVFQDWPEQKEKI